MMKCENLSKYMTPTSKIQADFDRIARVSGEEGWSHNSHYHGFLLKQLPARLSHVLDIGCGTGEFSRLLAARTDHVTALDLSPEMLRLAQERSSAQPNITYQQGDVLACDFPADSFDCIASIATLHHLSLDAALEKIARWLKPGGTLLVLDLFQVETRAELLLAAAGVPVSVILKLLKTRRWKTPPEVRAAWDEHGRDERYLTLSQVRSISAKYLPGAVVRQHLLWRYSLVWRKS
jgi:ubiquinone/menaquinone biosynthesis C-methylase UbiE